MRKWLRQYLYQIIWEEAELVRTEAADALIELRDQVANLSKRAENLESVARLRLVDVDQITMRLTILERAKKRFEERLTWLEAPPKAPPEKTAGKKRRKT